ncbi:hypothetical protein [Bordetella flabilis]|uniref:Uncharacterized protein n=1 Tax=Bordetella flabilis TaxID=463014 RepID=A0A193GLX1_9BORD|nr:hypothetical protein [Bordetella flabilis]ANN80865.1 hypothetical protein BAU07_26450 [Bordetella flabilis]
MTAATCRMVREHVLSFMSSLPGPGEEKDEEVIVRPDGVREFGRQWVVRRSPDESSLSATLSHRDNVIEFGLLQREGDEARNVLYATVVLDDEEVLLNVVSEADMDYNFDAKVDESSLRRLDDVLRLYASYLGGTSASVMQ